MAGRMLCLFSILCPKRSALMLRRARWALVVLFLSGVFTMTLAQTAPEKSRPRNIFDALEQIAPGEGLVTIIQASELRTRIGQAAAPRGAGVLGRDGAYTILNGYRIQLFNSNLPNAKSEAYARAEILRKVAPTLSGYITFRAPFWRLTVGNFLSHEEARTARARLLPYLPAWGKESYVVRERVRILNYTAPQDAEE